MEKDTTTVSEAVHKLQLALLDGIEDDNHLFIAGSLISKSDYQDVVTERSISNLCGYPLCPNSLPSDRPKKGQYRISMKDHKVYDLHEGYLYCCSSCMINSKAFSGSLKDERCSVMNQGKLNEILRLFKNVGFDDDEEEEVEVEGGFGVAKLTIKENDEANGGEVSMRDWVGPSNAIEGYVPQRDRQAEKLSRDSKKGSEAGNAKLNKHNDDAVRNGTDFEVTVKPNERATGSKKLLNNGWNSVEPLLSDMDFTSVIITNDEFSAPKNPSKSSKSKKPVSRKGKDSFFGDVDFMSTIITQDEYSVSKLPSSQGLSNADDICRDFVEQMHLGDAEKQFSCSEGSSFSTEIGLRRSIESADIGSTDGTDQKGNLAYSFHHDQNRASSSSRHVKEEPQAEKVVCSSQSNGKSSLKSSGAKKSARTVTWADEKPNGVGGGNLCEFREFKNMKEGPSTSRSKDEGENDESLRFSSAEACAMALIEAAEAVASGQADANNAVSEAGIIVLPETETADEEEQSIADDALEDIASEKWPKKPGNLKSDIFDSDSSWFDTAPEGFSLTLSPFAMMWDALFSWLTSYSLAYIYGREESCHEEYMSINGREYPIKVVLPDGRSPEIKQTLAGCLARALPGLIGDLKLPTPVSTLEHELACLLDTMSFMDALPPFRMKQWQVIALLFIDALSICRIPGLNAYLTSRRILIPKVLNGAQISAEEFEIMKDLVIPLGRVPQFSMQSGG